jgi:hypothetical protein
MTAHGTFVAVNAAGKLVHVKLSQNEAADLVRIEGMPGAYRLDGELSSFRISEFSDGLSLASPDQKFLCAEDRSNILVADREARGPWETFVPVPPERLSSLPEHNDPEKEMERFRQTVLKLQSEGLPVKVYCGAGYVPRKGFLNLDHVMNAPGFMVDNVNEYFVFPFAERQWSLPDNCVDYIFHEDFIEHIGQLAQIQFLAETRRVLKPGGWHRVNTPNILASMKGNSNFAEGFRGVYTGETKWGHISIFSPSMLKEMAELVGYREVVFTTKNNGVSPYAEKDFRPLPTDTSPVRDEILGNIYADLLK